MSMLLVHVGDGERHSGTRKRAGRSWEVTMAPPVDAVLLVSRNRLAALWAAFEG